MYFKSLEIIEAKSVFVVAANTRMQFVLKVGSRTSLRLNIGQLDEAMRCIYHMDNTMWTEFILCQFVFKAKHHF